VKLQLYIIEYIVVFWLNDILFITTTQRDSSHQMFWRTLVRFCLRQYCWNVSIRTNTWAGYEYSIMKVCQKTVSKTSTKEAEQEVMTYVYLFIGICTIFNDAPRTRGFVACNVRVTGE
jgi:hypothetical protein